MNEIMPLSALTEWDREPIHMPGAIQPHGFLLALHPSDLHVTHVSENLGSLFPLEAAAVIGQSPAALFGDHVGSLLPTVAQSRRANPGGTGLDTVIDGRRVRLLPFVSGSNVTCVDIVLEPELHTPEPALVQAQRIIQSLRLSRTHVGLCSIAVNDIRRVSGFDRVMVYRFDEDGSGDVVAESHATGVASFLGLKYPAADIPQQARRLYMLQRLRVIADVNAISSALLAEPGRRPQDLDLSGSSLRAPSRCHLVYLRNMGVTATAVVSLIVSGRLWGMLVCHHNVPWHVSADLRALLDLIGQVMSVMLGALSDGESSASRLSRQAALNRVATAMAKPDESIVDALATSTADLLTLVPADGVAVMLDAKTVLAGKVPEPAIIGTILQALMRLGTDDLIASAVIPSLCGSSVPLDGFAGALQLPLPNCSGGSIVWFRRELNLTVNWAGKPEEPIADPVTGRLEPRQSFASWTEEVRGRSERFTDPDLGAARDLRSIIDEAMVRRNESELLLRLRDNDPLTGLPNRRAVETHLKAIATIAIQPPTTLVVINIDRFRKVNELFGNSAGDALLVQVAQRLRLMAGSGEMVAHLGSDEFAVLSNANDASALGARVLGTFAQPFEIAKQVSQMSVSVGVADNAAADIELTGLLALAETAMRQAKTDGGGRVAFFARALRDKASRELLIEQCLAASLRSNREHFQLAFQPIVDVATGALRSWEVLARWHHPMVGSVPPGVFIPIAEGCGLIGAIGDLVLDEALRHLVDMPTSADVNETEVYLSVNVSPLQLTRKGFADEIESKLQSRGIFASRLCIEITEGVFTNAGAVATIAEIRQLGVLVAVDDFGIGHSSLSTLQRLPADVVKLDRSFLPEPDAILKSDRSFLGAVVQLAHTTGLKVVIEGVETQSQLDAVVQAGADAIQGYFMNRPMPSEAAVALACQTHEERGWSRKLESARRFASAPL